MFRITMYPAGDGDCLLVETGDPVRPHRILIDGGRKATYAAHLAGLFKPAASARQPIVDLLVLTHVDADHIEGLLPLVNEVPPAAIGEIWFNGGHHMSAARFGQLPPPAAPAAGTLGIVQAITLETALVRSAWPWNTSFKGWPVMVADAGSLAAKPIPGGELTLLGPPKAKLAAFAELWAWTLAEFDKPADKPMAAREHPRPLVGNLETLAAGCNAPDRAKPNGTSIAFIIAAEGKRCLFCADAHPDDIVTALSRLEPGPGAVKFDAIKAAHHGSGANNTSALLDRLHAPLWLISTDGSHNRHPDPEAIARIVLSEPKGKKILFNYQSRTEPWSNADLQKHYKYSIGFPPAGRPMVIEL